MFTNDGRVWARRCLALACFAASTCVLSAARAQDSDLPNGGFYEIETKYIFGFTEGTSIGLEGEKEVSAESVSGIGKGAGKYFATQTKLEFEHTPSQFFQFEAGALVMSHSIG